ncbi:MAG TPA: helix-turn-helix transcriptional regulator [Thermohalobaculum sp.]|nr:helix-turn-helix transcriptional regulator [Thermohalobaculum sp.]
MRHAVDVHVGQRVRQRRWMTGMTQQQLGDHVGIKFQQIQKYETGANRVSASRLWDIAATMEVPISFFFEGLEGQAVDTGESRGDILNDKEALDLVRAYYTMPETQRRRLFDLARVLSEAA